MTVAVQLWPPEVVTRTWPPTARGSVDRTPQEPSGRRRGRAGAGALATGTGELVPNPSAGSVGLVPKPPSEEPAELVPNSPAPAAAPGDWCLSRPQKNLQNWCLTHRQTPGDWCLRQAPALRRTGA